MFKHKKVLLYNEVLWYMTKKLFNITFFCVNLLSFVHLCPAVSRRDGQ